MSDRKHQGDLFGTLPLTPSKKHEKPKEAVRVLPAVEAPEPPPPEEVAPPVVAAPVPAWRRPVETLQAKPVEKPTGPLTVSQLTRQVKDAIEPRFSKIQVRGEISNFRGVNARGHFYFALTDAKSSIDVKLWATTAARLKFALKDGLSVIIGGSLDVYEPQGRYSLIVDSLEPEGLGAQALRFEQLKAKLVAEGLIGDKRIRPKRELPFLPRRIGVVTSVTGAALRDFLKVLQRRHPGIGVLVVDARVQGDNAVFELRKALRWLSKTDVDVIVVTRGGGSTDDLWTFNEEPVVRALWASTVPIVSAVGHEIDTTLSDLVADVRAPTPSAAAEMLAPSLVDLRAQLATLKSRVRNAMDKVLARERSALKDVRRRLGDPRRELSSQRLILSTGADRMRAVLSRRTRVERAGLRELQTRLKDPRHELASQRALLTAWRERMRSVLARRARGDRDRLAALKERLVDPRRTLVQQRLTLGAYAQRIRSLVERRKKHEAVQLADLRRRVEARSPRVELQRQRELLRARRDAAREALRRRQGEERKHLTQARQDLLRHVPRPRLAKARADLSALRSRLERKSQTQLGAARQTLDLLRARLHALDPLGVLQRGFALARINEHVVRRAAELKPDDQLELKFADGSVLVRVIK